MELLTENTLQYEIETETLTDSIMLAIQGIVHPKFIAPEQFQNQ